MAAKQLLLYLMHEDTEIDELGKPRTFARISEVDLSQGSLDGILSTIPSNLSRCSLWAAITMDNGKILTFVDGLLPKTIPGKGVNWNHVSEADPILVEGTHKHLVAFAERRLRGEVQTEGLEPIEPS